MKLHTTLAKLHGRTVYFIIYFRKISIFQGPLRSSSRPYTPSRAHPSDVLHVGVLGEEVRIVNKPRVPLSRTTRAGGRRAGRQKVQVPGVRQAQPGDCGTQGPLSGQAEASSEESSCPSAGAPCRRQDTAGGRGCLRSNPRNKGFVLWATDAMKGGRDTPTQSSANCHC